MTEKDLHDRCQALQRALADLLDTVERGDDYKVRERCQAAGRLLGLVRYEPDDVRQSIAACLLGETLGDHGVNVLRVADLLIKGLPHYGWTFIRSDSWRLRKDFTPTYGD